MEENLPKGWGCTKFTDVLGINGGTQPPKSHFVYEKKDGYVRLLQIRDFGNKPHPTFIPDKKNLRKCQIDDILIARYGASIGRILTGKEGAYNVAIAKVDIPKEIEKRYVYYYLNSYPFQSVITSFQRTAQSGFNKKDLSFLNFPLPPLAEQKRIVAKLDTLFASLDSTRARLETIPQLLKNFRQAVLTQAVTGKLTEEWREGRELGDLDVFFELLKKRRQNHGKKKIRSIKNNIREDVDLFNIPSLWRWSTLQFLMNEEETFRYGVVQPGKDVNGQQKLIRVLDLKNGKILKKQLRGISYEVDSKYKSACVKKGDLLVSIVGTIGRTAIITKEEEGYNIARAIARVPLTDVNPKYVKYYIDSDYGQNLLSGDAREVARKTLNLEQLKTLPIPVPPHEEQHEIVRRVESLFAKADAIEQQYQKLKDKVDTLPQAILAKAFRGELVPQTRWMSRQQNCSSASAPKRRRWHQKANKKGESRCRWGTKVY